MWLAIDKKIIVYNQNFCRSIDNHKCTYENKNENMRKMYN